MRAHIDKDKKDVELDFDGSVKLLLEELEVNPETVIVVRDNTLLTDDVILKNTDEVKILSVISGG